MAVNLSPLGGVAAQFFNNDGVPLSGGLIYTYLAGTNTPANTYIDPRGHRMCRRCRADRAREVYAKGKEAA